ncbi:ankyrin repeat and MYND domain-containing protein 1 [Elysia marginata]|uniref:Ankyrin repeat and MYND domain-containing protein 1 n=1 Tax=Elysia marginata TaxID=1093978 RepID=A0AAV4GM39_9GAST|nr:ankyrin repeat and MYND domain-containing protein 1 [Elysia marginata]
MLSLPPHTTHKLQPLDVSFFKSLQTYYVQECVKWLLNHPGRGLTVFQVAGILGSAFPRAASVGNITNGFQKSGGIWPCNRNIFTECDFQAFSRAIANVPENDSPDSDVLQPRCAASLKGEPVLPATQPPPVHIQRQHDSATTSVSFLQSKSVHIPVNSTSPLPIKEKNVPKKVRRTEQSEILTSSPNKKRLVEADTKKKKQIVYYSDASKNKTIGDKQTKPIKFARSKKVTNTQKGQNWYCFICDENLQEDMIKCTACHSWVHAACAGCELENYTCDLC